MVVRQTPDGKFSHFLARGTLSSAIKDGPIAGCWCLSSPLIPLAGRFRAENRIQKMIGQRSRINRKNETLRGGPEKNNDQENDLGPNPLAAGSDSDTAKQVDYPCTCIIPD